MAIHSPPEEQILKEREASKMNEVIETQTQSVAPTDLSTSAMLFDFGMIEKMNQLAEMMATSKISVPAHFRGSKGDCLAIVMQSVQWGMNPFVVAQKTFCIEGILGYEAQLVSAIINTKAPITGRLQYEWFGAWEKIVGKFREVESKTKTDKNGQPSKYRVPAWNVADEAGLGVKIWATMKGEAQPRELTIYMTQARVRNSQLWADDPKQQIAYLAAKRWARLYCSDVLMGVYTQDELEERIERDVTPQPTKPANEPTVTTQYSIDPEKREGLMRVAATLNRKELDKYWKDSLTSADRKAVTVIERMERNDPDYLIIDALRAKCAESNAPIDAQYKEVPKGEADDRPV